MGAGGWSSYQIDELNRLMRKADGTNLFELILFDSVILYLLVFCILLFAFLLGLQYNEIRRS